MSELVVYDQALDEGLAYSSGVSNRIPVLLRLVPKYDPTRGKLDLKDLISASPSYSEASQVLFEKGWPDYYAKTIVGRVQKRISQLSVIRTRREGPRELPQPRFEETKSRKTRVQAKVNSYGKGLGYAATAWRIKVPGKFPLVPLPEAKNFSQKNFKLWVYGQGTALRPFLKKKTQFISGNLSAHTLFYSTGPGTTLDRLQELLASAYIYIDDYQDIVRRPTQVTVAAFVDEKMKNGILIYGELVQSIEKLMTLSNLFKGNSPLFKTSLAYLAGQPYRGQPVDWSRLQEQLTKRFPPPPVEPIVKLPPPLKELRKVDPLTKEQIRDLSALHSWLVYPRKKTVHNPRPPLRSKKVDYGAIDLREYQIRRIAGRKQLVRLDLEPEVPKVSLEGNSMGKVEVQHTIQVSNNPPRENIKDVVKDIGGELLVELGSYEQIGMQVISLFAAIAVSESWKSTIACVVQFIMGNNYLYSKMRDYVTALSGEFFVREGPFEFLFGPVKSFLMEELFSPIWEAIVGAGVLTILRGLLGTAVESFTSSILELIKHIRFSLFKEAGATIAKSMMSAITEVVRRVRSAWEQKSLTPLWGRRWDPRSWVKQLDCLMVNQPMLTDCTGTDVRANEKIAELREAGLLDDSWVEPIVLGDYVNRFEEHLALGRSINDHFKFQPLISKELSQCLTQGKVFIDGIKFDISVSHERVCPFGVISYGIPGTGKSNLTLNLLRAVAAKRKYPSEQVYNWQMNVNFQDPFKHQWGVVFDEVDASLAPLARGQNNHCEDWLRLNNNTPYPVEKADVAMKGKVYASPMLVWYNTNFPDCKVTTHCGDPIAFWRRARMYLRVVANASFASGDEGMMDVKKSACSDTWDMYDIYVRRFDSKLIDKNNRNCFPFGEEVKYSFPEFAVMFHKEMDEHIARERALLKARSDEGPTCKHCGLNRMKACGHMTPMYRWDVELSEALPFHHEGVCSDFTEEVKQTVKRSVDWLMRARTLAESVTQLDALVRRYFNPAYFLASAAALGSAVICIKLLRKYFEYEGREANATGLLPPSWFRATQEYKPGEPPVSFSSTFTKEELGTAITSSFVKVRGPEFSLCGYAVAHNAILVPSHVCKTMKSDGSVSDELFDVVISTPNKDVACKVDQFTFRALPSNPEICVLLCPDLKGTLGITKKLPLVVDEQIHQFDEVEVWSNELEGKPSWNQVYLHGRCRTLTTDFASKPGDCGKLYVARFGKSWKIVAMHYGKIFQGMFTNKTIAALLTEQEVVSIVKSLATSPASVVTYQGFMSKDPASLEFRHYPKLSEVWAAVSQHGASVYPIGELSPPLSGSTMKTKVKFSLIADDVRDMADEWCGQPGYWNLPNFRGKMVDDKWTSPYTNCFASQNNRTPDSYYMWLALADYLSGMEKLDGTGFTSLSEEQVLSGIPGSYVHSVNTKTSVGPPFNRSKRLFMFISLGESYMDEEVWKHYDYVGEVLKSECIPAAFGIVTLKDEAVKPNKLPRGFICLPFSYNAKMKQHLSAVKSFIRANFSFFESAVGINMTSPEANKIIAHLQRLDPDLTRLYDGDARMLDKSYNGTIWDFVALVNYAIAWRLGIDYVACHLLVLGVKHTRYSIKNDIFSTFWNPSGNDCTVEFNGQTISLCERYVYYRLSKVHEVVSRDEVEEYQRNFFINPIPKFGDKLTFRDDVALVHYGDDKLQSMRCPVSPLYESIWFDELGLEMTDASKSGKMRAKTLKEVSFLKREFVLDPEFLVYLTPLSLKSLARTLMIKKESTLSDRDHACVAMSEVLREAVYHGRGFYNRLVSKFIFIAERHGLLYNPLFKVEEYEHWREKIKDGTFSTWEFDRRADHLRCEDENF